MQTILSDFEEQIKRDSDNENLSIVSFIAGVTEDVLTHDDIERSSKLLCYILTHLSNQTQSRVIELVLNQIDYDAHFSLDNIPGEVVYKIQVKNRWLFQIILLNSVKYSDMLVRRKDLVDEETKYVCFIIQHIINCINIKRPKSIYLLRTLLFILSKYSHSLTPSLRVDVLKCMSKVSISPIPNFKQYAQGISKLILPLCVQQINFLNINLFPLNGIDSRDLIKLYSKDYIKANIVIIIKRVLKLFLNNVDNKDGGVLYESILFYSFENWSKEIWPLFLEDLQQLEFEGEFFQSLLKYWIPLNVQVYKDDFYRFIRAQQINDKLKAYILLETKKKGFADDFTNDVLSIFFNIRTEDLGLKLMTTYHKKNILPRPHEIKAIMHYFHSIIQEELDDEEVKCFQLFNSQIFLYGHSDLKKNKGWLQFYADIINNIYKLCLDACSSNLEVGSQLLQIVWDVSTGSHKNLTLLCKLDKKDFYEQGENMLYKELQARNLWPFKRRELVCGLESHGPHSSKLLYNYYLKEVCIDPIQDLLDLIDEQSKKKDDISLLKDIEKARYISEAFCNGSECIEKVKKFLDQAIDSIGLDMNFCKEYDHLSYMKASIYLELIMIAIKNKLFVELLDLHYIGRRIEESLNVMNHILDISNNTTYKNKDLSILLNSTMTYMIVNCDNLWPAVDKRKILTCLLEIIQKCNMKKSVCLCAEVLAKFARKMEENEVHRHLKIQILDETIKSMYNAPTELETTIRKCPEYRLVIHAMCFYEKDPNKPLLCWIVTALLDIISDTRTTDSAISSALYSLEILVLDNNLQNDTLQFIPLIVVKCIEIFARTSWTVRNADLQLAKALFDRFYGVHLNINNNRLKSIEDFFMLFPNLSSYFFKILSLEELDERSILVFQFFIESQIKQHLFCHKITKVALDGFCALFTIIIKKYPNNYGKLAVRSYTSLCLCKDIPEIFCDIVEFLKNGFNMKCTSIFSNFSLLLEELYQKYTESFEHTVNKIGIQQINFAIKNLVEHVRKFENDSLNFMLFKFKTPEEILQNIDSKFSNTMQNRLWLHNNIPFLVINTKPHHLKDVLSKILSKNLPGYMHVKVLSILVSRFQNNDFNNENLTDITCVLFEKSLSVDTFDYSLLCYLKVISLFSQKGLDTQAVTSITWKFNVNPRIDSYKSIIFTIYLTMKENCVDNDEFQFCGQNLLNIFLYGKSIPFDDIVDDILPTLGLFMKIVPKGLNLPYLEIMQLGLCLSLRTCDFLEACNFISLQTGNRYYNIVEAMKGFLSKKNLRKYLNDDNIIRFLNYVKLIREKSIMYSSRLQSTDYNHIECFDGEQCLDMDYLEEKINVILPSHIFFPSCCSSKVSYVNFDTLNHPY